MQYDLAKYPNCVCHLFYNFKLLPSSQKCPHESLFVYLKSTKFPSTTTPEYTYPRICTDAQEYLRMSSLSFVATLNFLTLHHMDQILPLPEAFQNYSFFLLYSFNSKVSTINVNF